LKSIVNRKNKYIGFNDIPFMIIGIPVLAVIVSMIFFGIGLSKSVLCYTSNLIPSTFFTSLFWFGDRYIIIKIRKKFPSASDNNKRLYVASFFVILYTAFISIALHQSEPAFKHVISNMQHPSFAKSFITCLFATALVATIYEAAYFVSKWKESIAEAEKLKRENTIAQLEALKSQVNPHFLFNSLNTLASIIPEDPDRSVEFVQKLSAVYRCILDINEKTAISLNEELACLENYCFLLKTRFGDSLTFEMRIDESARSMYVVPLSLQLLVENAVKHNIVSTKKPLHIKVSALNNSIAVENNLQVKSQQMDGTQSGLKNISNRYRLAFEKDIEVAMNETTFKVVLPLIKISDYEIENSRNRA
jgi:two-component system LytT family sensor kinase